MYHQVTAESQRARKRHFIAACIVAAACLVAVIVAVGAAQANAREQGAASVREAILASAKQCCAVEGSYPTTYQYLEDHYGLRVNDKDYVITYESFASNVMPNVVVVPR